MKRFILMAAAAALLAIPAAEAQKVNKEATLSKLEKSDADIANPKKNAKAATWINRGRVYYDAAAEPTANLFAPMETTLLKLSVGDPTSTEEVTLNGSKAIAWNYPYFIAYERDGKIVAWKQLQEIKEGALDTAIEAYNKAYELDPKQASKIKNGLEQISNYASILGNVSIEAGEYLTGAEAYLAAYKAQQCPAFGEADPALLYYAGYLLTVDGANHPESFARGAQALNDALAAGYTDEAGDVYYYLFHSYYGQKDKDAAFLIKAKDALLAGIEKFPKNEKILDGLMQLYTSEEGVGDPADLVGMIDKSLESDPDNVDLWFGRGQLLSGPVLYGQGRRHEHRDGAEELPQPVGVRCRPERGERRLHGGSALLREGASAQTRRRGYGRLHQVDQLPSARRTGYDGQVQRVH